MAVAYGSIASAAGENTNTLTITKPSSLAAGDMMVAMLINRGGPQWDTPSGWTAKGTVNVSNQYMACFAKVASAGDAAATDFSFTFSGGGTRESVGILVRLTGTFTDASNVTGSTTDTDATPDANDNFVFSNTSLSPIANAFLVAAAGSEATNASTTTACTISVATSNPTWTERAFQGQPNGDDVVISLSTASRPETTDIGATTADFNSTGNLSNGTCIVVAVHETANASVSPAVVTLTGAVQAPTVAGDANVSPSVVTMTGTIQAPTVTTGSPKWSNTDKSSAGSVTNPDKS